ncbi:transposase [Bergeyella zoohelcum]|uniref:transposase n=1 Tax=Bergeyella zoohelcum TaxID=1015 RepID=UPI0021AA3935|nr:transposase [Bergeyella zoohelcum]
MWNNLSDVKVEEHVNDSLSAMKFCGMQLEDNIPSYSVLSRFRTEITEKKAFDLSFRKSTISWKNIGLSFIKA